MALRRLSICLLAPFGSPSHPCGSASDGDGGSVIASLDCPHAAPIWRSSCAACYPLSPNPIYSSPYRLIVSSPRLLDTGDGAGALIPDCLPLRLGRRCCSISPAVYLCGFCGGWHCVLSCLLGCCIFIYVDGGCNKRDGACLAFDCLDAPAYPLFSPSPFSTHKRPRVFFLHPFIARIACRFSFDAPRPIRLINHGGRVEVFLCVLCAVSLIKRRWRVRCQFNRFGSNAHRFPRFPASVPLRVRRVPLPVCLLVLSMMSCRHRIRYRF